MTEAGSPSAQDVADALAMTLEREDASGAPWCPPGDAVAVRRWVTDRSASLGTGIRRVVRLARIMAIADGRDYVSFLYIKLTTLRSRLFRHVLERAFAEGRIPMTIATLSDTGVHLREAAVTGQVVCGLRLFEIDFAQMPRLAALLDFLHNALGFSTVADLIAPALQRGAPAGAASEVSRALHAALNAWLSSRLESANHMLQAKRIRAFVTTRGRLVPETIDDESIFLFWTAMADAAEDDNVEGFRLYRSAAGPPCCVTGRRGRDAATTRPPRRIGWGEASTAPTISCEADRAGAGTEHWQSPLRALALPSASRVKWLTRKDRMPKPTQLSRRTGGRWARRDEPEWRG